MGTQTDKLLAKADEFQKKADALRYAAEVLNESGTASVARRMPTALQTALAMREEARAYQHGATVQPAPAKLPYGARYATAKARRARTGALLATFDRVKPKPINGSTLSVLVQHGYLKKKGDGYVRTAKVFNAGAPPNGSAAKKSHPRRQHPSRQPRPSELKKALARDEKARIVAGILKEHGPLTSRELSKLVAEQIKVGPTGLTGIYAYVQRGYITQQKTKGGTTRDGFTYAFKAMPPEANANGAEAT